MAIIAKTFFEQRAITISILNKLSAAAEKHQCDIYAYVLMTNHIDLLVTPHIDNGIGKMMQTLGRYYLQYVNHR